MALKRPSSTGPKLAKRPATAGANLAKRPAAAEGNARGPKEFPPSEIFGYRSDLRLSPLTLAWAPDPNRQWMTNGDLPSAQRVTNGDIVLSLQVVPKSVNWQATWCRWFCTSGPMVQMVLSRWHTTISVSGRVRCARKAPGILLARPEEWKSAAFPLECHYYECKNCHMDVKLAVPIPYTRAGYSRYYDWTDYKIACAGCMFHHASALARKYLLQSQRKVVMAPKEFEMKYSGKLEIHDGEPGFSMPCSKIRSSVSVLSADTTSSHAVSVLSGNEGFILMHHFRSEVITGDEIGTVKQ